MTHEDIAAAIASGNMPPEIAADICEERGENVGAHLRQGPGFFAFLAGTPQPQKAIGLWMRLLEDVEVPATTPAARDPNCYGQLLEGGQPPGEFKGVDSNGKAIAGNFNGPGGNAQWTEDGERHVSMTERLNEIGYELQAGVWTDARIDNEKPNK